MSAAVAEQAVDEVVDPVEEEFDFLNEEPEPDVPAESPPANESTTFDIETPTVVDQMAETAAAIGMEQVSNATDAALGLIDGLDMTDAELVKTLNEPETAETIPETEADHLRRRIRFLESELDGRQSLEQEIRDQSARVRRLFSEKTAAKSAVEEAKGELKAANERYESALTELREMLEEQAIGSRMLPFVSCDATDPTYVSTKVKPEPVATAAATPPRHFAESPSEFWQDDQPRVAENPTELRQVDQPPPAADEGAKMPIQNLGQKQMIAMYNRDHWTEAKERDEPYGMTTNEIGILEAAEIFTIGDLETKMRADEWWYKKIAKFGDKKVGKLSESHRLFRVKYPMPA